VNGGGPTHRRPVASGATRAEQTSATARDRQHQDERNPGTGACGGGHSVRGARRRQGAQRGRRDVADPLPTLTATGARRVKRCARRLKAAREERSGAAPLPSALARFGRRAPALRRSSRAARARPTADATQDKPENRSAAVRRVGGARRLPGAAVAAHGRDWRRVARSFPASARRAAREWDGRRRPAHTFAARLRAGACARGSRIRSPRRHVESRLLDRCVGLVHDARARACQLRDGFAAPRAAREMVNDLSLRRLSSRSAGRRPDRRPSWRRFRDRAEAWRWRSVRSRARGGRRGRQAGGRARDRGGAEAGTDGGATADGRDPAASVWVEVVLTLASVVASGTAAPAWPANSSMLSSPSDVATTCAARRKTTSDEGLELCVAMFLRREDARMAPKHAIPT